MQTYHSAWGAAEWIGLVGGVTMLLAALTTLIVQLHRIRNENSSQHAEGRALVTDVRDRLLDLHTSVDRVDGKVDKVADRIERHVIEDHQEPPAPPNLRRWR